MPTKNLLRDHPWLVEETDELRLDEFARLQGIQDWDGSEIIMFSRAEVLLATEELQEKLLEQQDELERLKEDSNALMNDLADARYERDTEQRRAWDLEADLELIKDRGC